MVRVEVKGMELEEFVELFQTDGWSLETLTAIHRESRGVLRTIRAMFLVIDDYIARLREQKVEAKRSDIAPQHVRLIAQHVVPVKVDGELARRS